MNSVIRWRELSTSLVVLAIGIIYLLWARAYPPELSAVPTLVAWLTIVLALIDAASQTETRVGRISRRVVGQQAAGEAAGEAKSPPPGWRAVVFSVLWPLSYVAAVIVAGFLLVTPVYIFLYMVLYGHQRMMMSAMSALITTGIIWLVFEFLFHYPLFPGIMFGGIF
jgi:hypothetical protein